MITQNNSNKGLLIFDGYCILCSWSVRFILKRDKKDYFRYVALQSEYAKQIISSYNLPVDFDKSIVLISENKIWLKSDAVLQVVSRLNGIWPIFGIFRIIPKRMRDSVYMLISKYRYKLFGKRNDCYIPEKKDMQKYIF
ncbi:MAG: hypothetical protein A2041_11405 [Bacteroidetes bacterium GWA2_31_9b]|nr:MAG: hypothetical protein A2041_11405 [Bacteroidetes bacterium GWA2_31_9b]